eukprot:COSAG02_NODE_75748_length_142_cov_23.325581_1_plen_42_part_10
MHRAGTALQTRHVLMTAPLLEVPQSVVAPVISLLIAVGLLTI